MEPKETKDYNRFDLENQLCLCWEIMQDLKEEPSEYAKGLAVVYDRRFQKLWDIFEDMVHTGKM